MEDREEGGKAGPGAGAAPVMDLWEALRNRRSIRRYRPDPVPPESLERVLEGARLAPTWANGQPLFFVVVREQAKKDRLSELSAPEEYRKSRGDYRGYWQNPAREALRTAPLVLVAVADPRRSGSLWGMDFYLVDTGLVMAQLFLAAHAEGLGTCYVGVYHEEAVKELLGVPEPLRVVGLTPLGYPAEAPGPRPRKPLAELWSEETFPPTVR